MVASQVPQAPARTPTYRDLFSVADYRALWAAQLLSIAGDQLARVALTVLVYQRTGSALYAAGAYAISVVPALAGSVGLGWVADRWPRRDVLVGGDLISAGLVAVMAVPGVPLPVLLVLLAAVTAASGPYMAARGAVNRDVLGADLYTLGQSVTQATYMAGQVAGFALGGVIVAVAGARVALAGDAATFALSAGLIWAWLSRRPAAGGGGSAGLLAGVRVIWASPVARVALSLELLAGFFGAVDGVAAPLAVSFGGGPGVVGVILAVTAGGAVVGMTMFGRVVPARWQQRSAGVLPLAACAVLVLFAFRPGVAWGLVILAASALCAGYMAATSSAIAEHTPAADRGKVFGAAGGLLLGVQGVTYLAAGAAAAVIGARAVIVIWAAAGVAAAGVLALSWHRVTAGGQAR